MAGSIILLSVVLSFFADFVTVEACLCAWTHSQKLFCDAEIAIKGEVLEVRRTGDRFSINAEKIYRVKLLEVFKEPQYENLMARGEVEIETPGNDGICGVSLDKNKEYLLTGSYKEVSGGKKRISIHSCGWNKEFNRLTEAQANGITGKYDCDCEVETNTIYLLQAPPNKCKIMDPDYLSSSMSCLGSHAACNKDGKTGMCRWQFFRRPDNCE